MRTVFKSICGHAQCAINKRLGIIGMLWRPACTRDQRLSRSESVTPGPQDLNPLLATEQQATTGVRP